MQKSYIRIRGATFVRPGGKIALQSLDWEWQANQVWAITGAVGAGKSSFLEALQGNLRLLSGTLEYPILTEIQQTQPDIYWPNQFIQLVRFKEESRLFSYSQHYYQQRYNFLEKEEDLKVIDFLTSNSSNSNAYLRQLIEQFHLQPLLDRSLIQLSNGQTRRLRLAKALLQQPAILLLDDPLVGLDTAMREEFLRYLETIHQLGQKFVFVTSSNFIPNLVTHRLHFQAGTVIEPPAVTKWPEITLTFSNKNKRPKTDLNPIVELKNVNVRYQQQEILTDINWQIYPGERWALLGANGSGKSTLLSMIYADHPQVYANEVYLFGNRRGQGESIWEVKKRIGFLSPEFHLYFHERLTVQETIATGFTDQLVWQPLTAEQQQQIDLLLQQFEIGDWADRPFEQLSSGEQRVVLLIRSFIKTPDLLILDEPFQGLDEKWIARMRHCLDNGLLPHQAFIFVSHLYHEIPETITHHLVLKEGRL